MMAQQRQTKLAFHQVQQLATNLQEAIQKGEKQRASTIAELLASERASVGVMPADQPSEQSESSPEEICLSVQVEDRVKAGPELKIEIRPNITILELKIKFWEMYSFPVEVQRWILDRRFMEDHQTLANYGITMSNAKVFLYLISAKSAKVEGSRTDYHQSHQHEESFGQVQTQPSASLQPKPLPSFAPSFGAQPLSTMTRSAPVDSSFLPAPQQSLPMNIGLPLPTDPFHAPSMAPTGAEQVTSRPPFVPPAAMYPTASQQPARPNPTSSSFLWQAPADRQGPDPTSFAQPNIPLQPTAPNPATASSPAGIESPADGWVCNECTLINEPTRPGCVVCSSDRPVDYQVPLGAPVSDAERRRLEKEQLQDRLAMEGVQEHRNITGLEGGDP